MSELLDRVLRGLLGPRRSLCMRAATLREQPLQRCHICLLLVGAGVPRELFLELPSALLCLRQLGRATATRCARKLVDKPASVADDDMEIRFLDQAELDALLAVQAARRHSKRTLERAATARALRDQERLRWKEIGETLGCSSATAIAAAELCV